MGNMCGCLNNTQEQNEINIEGLSSRRSNSKGSSTPLNQPTREKIVEPMTINAMYKGICFRIESSTDEKFSEIKEKIGE